MTGIWAQVALIFGRALIAPVVSVRFRVSAALPEIIAGVIGSAIFSGIALVVVEMSIKVAGVYPVARLFGSPQKDAMYRTLLMASGLTFGVLASLFGLSQQVIEEANIRRSGGDR